MNTHTLNLDDSLLLSPVQQERQRRIFEQGTAVVRNSRITARIETQQTGQLTYLQSVALRTVEADREEQRLRVIAKNFERRQMALLAE